MSKFLLGIAAPFQGAQLILRHGQLKKLALFPVLLTILFLFVGIFSGFFYSGEIISLLFSQWLVTSAGFVQIVLTVFGYILITIFVFLFSYLFAAIVSIPFNSLLAERALGVLEVYPPKTNGLNQQASKFFRMLGVSIVKACVVAILIAVMFVTSFIPGVSLVALYVGLLLLAFDCMDYSLEVLGLNFSQRVAYLRRHLTEISGFAFVLGLIFLVPFFNFLLLPVAVAGGAYLVGNNVKRQSS